MKKMQMIQSLTTAAAACFLTAANPAFAQGWYAGAGIGYSNASTDPSDLGPNSGNVDGGSTSYALSGGLEFNKYIGLEVGYYDFGTVKFKGTAGTANVAVSGSGKAKAYGLSVVGMYPITEELIPYARIGFGRSKVEANVNAVGLTGNNGNNWRSETLYAAGVRYMFNKNWGVFAEWTKADDIRVDDYVIGAQFHF